ncbi:MAG: ATP-binding protein [Pseudomonadota bacterium]
MSSLPTRSELLRHDIRSALADILGGLDLLGAPGAGDCDQIGRVRASAKALAGLLTAFDAAEDADPEACVAATIDAWRAGSALTDRWTPRATASGVTLDLDYKLPGRTRLAIAPVAFDRLFGNLLENAIRHAPLDAVAPRVALSFTLCGAGLVRVHVVDTGPGISSALRDRAFLPGTSTTGDAGGQGLGLYIAREIALQFGGSVALIDGPGDGTVVEVTLPLAKEVSVPAASPAAQPLSGVRVLVVEDNETNRFVATEMLRTLGASCETATDGISGAARLRAQPFDLALVDIEMPRRNGTAMIEGIRADADLRLASMPLVACTAFAMDHQRARILAAGADGVIAKPLTDIAAFGAELAGYLQHGALDAAAAVDTDVMAALRDAMGAGPFAAMLAALARDLTQAATELRAGAEPPNAKVLGPVTHQLMALAGTAGANGVADMARTMNGDCAAENAPTADRVRNLAHRVDALAQEVTSMATARPVADMEKP